MAGTGGSSNEAALFPEDRAHPDQRPLRIPENPRQIIDRAVSPCKAVGRQNSLAAISRDRDKKHSSEVSHMSLFEKLEYSFRFALGETGAATWIWVIITLMGIIFLVGSFWGRQWNREWSIMRHKGFFATILFFASLAAYAVLNLRTVDRMESWFLEQRKTLPQSIANSARLKRAVIVETWNRLEPKQGQADLVPPDQSGDQVRLNTPEDAAVLAGVAAEETAAVLRTKAPFSIGAPLDTKSPKDIANETIDLLKVDASGYPKTIQSDNEWSATAATIQVNYALDTAQSLLRPQVSSLKTACLWLFGLALAIPIILTAIRAIDDIKVNPKP